MASTKLIFIPPMTVAAIHMTNKEADGKGAETVTAELLNGFIRKTDLKNVYPAARHFGFNNPDGLPDDSPEHGYERWISIPDDMEVEAPFVKKRFDGSLYAAHCIDMGHFEEWGEFAGRIMNSTDLEICWGTVPGVCGWLEEHLNHWDWDAMYMQDRQQLDLLIPIRVKEECIG